MTNLAEQFKHSADHVWDSMTEGWRELSSRASGALTRLRPASAARPASQSDPCARQDDTLLPFGGWAFMAWDVVDDDKKVIVRLEAPGMRREDFNIELRGDTLTVSGEKQSDREVNHGRYSVVQCAYGNFKREVLLPVPVKGEASKANYRDGVLRIELPKAEGARARQIVIKPA